MFVHYSIHVFVFYVPCICIVVLSLQVKKKIQTIKIVCLPSGFQLWRLVLSAQLYIGRVVGSITTVVTLGLQ